MTYSRTRARQALDERLDLLRPLAKTPRPHKGWVRAVREALGMSGVQLARLLSITPQSIRDMEKSEAQETIRLETLRKAANALDCQLVYALVPNDSLQTRIDSRARQIALRELGAVSHSMAIEDQAVKDDDLEERIASFIANNLTERDLWNEE